MTLNKLTLFSLVYTSWCFWTMIPNVANVSSSAFKNSHRNLARDFWVPLNHWRGGKNHLSGVEHPSEYAYIRHGIYKAESGSGYLTAALLSCRDLWLEDEILTGKLEHLSGHCKHSYSENRAHSSSSYRFWIYEPSKPISCFWKAFPTCQRIIWFYMAHKGLDLLLLASNTLSYKLEFDH